MGPIACPETLVRNYHNSLRNNPEERSSHLLHGRSLRPARVCFSQDFSALGHPLVCLVVSTSPACSLRSSIKIFISVFATKRHVEPLMLCVIKLQQRTKQCQLQTDILQQCLLINSLSLLIIPQIHLCLQIPLDVEFVEIQYRM
jgi:hypothetical protein